MLLLELEQRRPELANVLALHGRPSSSLCLSGTREIIRANARLRKGSSMEVRCLAGGPEAGRGDAPTRAALDKMSPICQNNRPWTN
jgi:hypothetical protein